MQKFTAIAPAKINLQLRVFPKAKNEEFHKVENVMQTLTLHDKLTFLIPESDEDFEQIRSMRNRKINDAYGVKDAEALTFEKNSFSVTILVDDKTGQNLQILPQENLITKALLACVPEGRNVHVEVFVEKNIPAQAGLGGGSSDAAATLQMAKKLFSIADEEALNIAGELGSDVPFFLTGGRATMSHTGATLAETLPSLKNPVVLVKPDVGVNTAACYEQYDTTRNTAKPTGQFGLLNDLQEPACVLEPAISDTLNMLKNACNPANVLMTGSGSCCYAICETFEQARKVATLATSAGFWARACSCANVKASLID